VQFSAHPQGLRPHIGLDLWESPKAVRNGACLPTAPRSLDYNFGNHGVHQLPQSRERDLRCALKMAHARWSRSMAAKVGSPTDCGSELVGPETWLGTPASKPGLGVGLDLQFRGSGAFNLGATRRSRGTSNYRPQALRCQAVERKAPGAARKSHVKRRR
jgi:hypothetical protein